ncbi:hypothetical protein [Arthrobacter sp. H14]|uniref:hypothetical protein n=1 Tax=Arthrobacter sp. H14 TaxID=1312959 RepID=UPI000478AF90|nr:hypothetical protein [Arthrobacter sp. H14]
MTTTDIRIATPITSSVLLTLGQLIDAAWPGAQMATNEDPTVNQIVFRVDHASRTDVTDERAKSLVTDPDPDGDLELHNLGPDGVSIRTPSDVAAALLPVLESSFEVHSSAANYLEIPVHNPDTGHRYLLTFCRSKGQTPHNLRMQAEEKLEQAHTTVHRSDVTAVQTLLRGNRSGTFEDGVKAALDALRQSAFSRTQTIDD